ncbi:M56 family metallopeptidase [Robertkochia solimangrovi]|uniref:M56 family metallopeptidase n=1 Tax=Robertkochia solimangrovi TaxID=2213046 RepID=UPI0013A57CC8|nr:M56 family metallopeptidase [Robertkochia solimangrovi]
MSKETFFKHNRLFLMTGSVIAVLLPYFEIIKTKTITLHQNLIQPSFNISETTPEAPAVSTEDLLTYIYVGGLLFFGIRFLIQLLSLYRLSRQCKRSIDRNFVLLTHKHIETPFSFFRYILINPDLYDENEFHTIMEHEKIHVRQWHSLDIIFMHLLTIVLWFNPFTWLYRKSVAQNLEFLADKGASEITESSKAYQYILLKQHTNHNQLSIINPFFNSLIKKRIVMLHQNPSKKRDLFKLVLPLPFLLIFTLMFNTRTVAQYKVIQEEKMVNNEAPITKTSFILSNKMSDSDLESLKKDLKSEYDLDFDYSRVKRNEDGLISRLKVKLQQGSNKASASYEVPDGIPALELGVKNGDQIFIHKNHEAPASTGNFVIKTAGNGGADTIQEVIVKGYGSSGASNDHNAVWVTEESGDDSLNKAVTVTGYIFKNNNDSTTVKGLDTSSTKTFTFTTENDDAHTIVKSTGGNTAQWIQSDSANTPYQIQIKEVNETKSENGEKQFNVTVSEDSGNGMTWVTREEQDTVKTKNKIVIRQTSEKGNGMVVTTNQEGTPLYILDGKEITQEELQNLSPENIASISVLKDHSATNVYGEKGKNGVILITSKTNAGQAKTITEKSTFIVDAEMEGAYFEIDGKPATSEQVKNLDPSKIASVMVFKGEQAITKYGDKAKKGAIIIKMN